MLRDLHGVNKENVGVFNCDIQDGCRDFWQPFWISHIAAHEKRWNFIVWKTKSQTFQNNFPGNILVIPWNNIPKWNLARFRLIRNRQSLFKQVCDKNFLLTKLTCESRCLYLVLICWPRDRVYWQGSQNRIAKIWNDELWKIKLGKNW